MATYSYPEADNADQTGLSSAWVFNGAASAFDCIDDTQGAPDDDATYLSRVFNAAIVGNPGVRLSDVTDPLTDTGWQVKIRVKSSSIGSQNIVIELYQGDPASGGSVLEAKTQAVGSSYSTFTWTLADATIAAVSDFADLWFRITTSGAAATTCRLSSLYLIVPDAPLVAAKSALLPMTGCQ